jgi:hypothetical protein
MRFSPILFASLVAGAGLAGCAAEPDAPDSADDAGLASVDEAVRAAPPPDMVRCHADADHDGRGGPSWYWHRLPCPAGRIEEDASDCDDHDASFWSYSYYLDADHDGYGLNDPSRFGHSCYTTPPTGYATNGFDCNDDDAATHPRDCLQDDDGDSTWTVQGRCAAACPSLPRPDVSVAFASHSPAVGQSLRFDWNVNAPAHCRVVVDDVRVSDGVGGASERVLVQAGSGAARSGSWTVTPQRSRLVGAARAHCDTVPGSDVARDTSERVYQRTTTSAIVNLRQAPGPANGGFLPYGETFTLLNNDAETVASGIQNVSGVGLAFVKIGHTTDECGTPSAVVGVAPGGSLDLEAVYGAASVHAPFPIIACKQATAGSPPASLPVSVTYTYTGEAN